MFVATFSFFSHRHGDNSNRRSDNSNLRGDNSHRRGDDILSFMTEDILLTRINFQHPKWLLAAIFS